MTTDTRPTPTDVEIDAIVYKQTGFDGDGTQPMTADEMRRVTRAVLARWGQPAHSGEPVYAFRRKGLDDFCTCTEERYAELSTMPHLFETRFFYTAPQPVEREPLTDAQIKGLIEGGVFFGNCKEIVRAIEAAHGIGIKGGQHD